MTLDSIIENALDAVITIDSAGVITGWNQQAETTFGWPRQETIGLRLSDTIIPPQYRDAHERGMEHYLATGEGPVLNKRIEITALHRDGHEFPVELAITPLHTGDDVTFSAFVRNITKRKRAAEALRESEARTRVVLDTAADGIITIDENGIVESFNPAAANIFGYTGEEVIGQNVSMLMPEPYHSRHNDYMARYLATGQAKIIGIGREIEGQRKDGAIFPLYLAISEVQLADRRIFTGIVRDISDIKQAQESLQKLNEELEQRVFERTAQLAQTNAELNQEIVKRERLEQRYRDLFEEAPAMYVITENRGGVPYIIDCNSMFSSVTCYSRRDILGSPLHNYYSPASREEMISGGYQRALSSEFSIEDRQLLTSDGRIVETLLRARPELDADGNVIGTRAMFIDITARKQLETAEREQRQLAEALSETALFINSTLDFDVVLDRLLEKIAGVIQCDVAQVLLVEDDFARLVRLRDLGQSERVAADNDADVLFNIVETDNLRQILETGLPLVISDTASIDSWQHITGFSNYRSWIGAPILVQDDVVAFFALYKAEPDFYQSQDIERLKAFANQAGIAFENVRLYEATRHQVKELTTLNAISQAATSTLQLDEVMQIITNRIFNLLEVEAASLVLKDEAANELLFATAVGVGADIIKGKRIGTDLGIVGWCIEHSEPALVPDVAADTRFYPEFDQTKNHTTHSVLCVPLQSRGKSIGAVEVINKKVGRFNEQDLRLLSSLAASVAAAVENAQLYKQVHRYAINLEKRVAEKTADLSAANAELARAARMKDEFLASMSHELRTPLNAVLGMSEALQEQTFGPLNEEQLDALHDIEESGRHLLNLINDILDLSKIEAGKLELQIEPVLIEDVSQASLRLIKQSAHKNRLKVLYTLDEMVNTVLVDERYLKQILVNLLSNAVKFTPEGGRIGLEIMGDAAQDVVSFTVWDTGIGIPHEDLDRLFQPFVQLDSSLDRSYSGTGLGLALVYRMAELHDGSVSVSSEPEQGSRFTVTLPWKRVESNAAPEEEDVPAVLSAQIDRFDPHQSAATNLDSHSLGYKPLILLAEDNKSNIKTFSRYLSRVGYRVEVALNGLEAITQARVLQPDLILMDIQMPEMDGLEAMQHLQADPYLVDIPIIAVTALAMPGDKERCLAAGASEYISKPVNLKMLAETIATVLANSPGRTTS